mgnify:CR=1 FL=1
MRARGGPTHEHQAGRRRAGAHAGGAIVNVSSAAAKLGGAGQYVDYAAAKGGIETFTIGLAKEVAAEGIRVNAVRPGIIDTEIHASGGTPDRVRQITPQLPMQRAGTADEVGEAIVWLLSDASSYTTGSIVEVVPADVDDRLTAAAVIAASGDRTAPPRFAPSLQRRGRALPGPLTSSPPSRRARREAPGQRASRPYQPCRGKARA